MLKFYPKKGNKKDWLEGVQKLADEYTYEFVEIIEITSGQDKKYVMVTRYVPGMTF